MMSDEELQKAIADTFDNRELLKDDAHADAVEEAMELLDCGDLAIAEKIDGTWITNAWAKKAILLYFQLKIAWNMEGVRIEPKFGFANQFHYENLLLWHDKVPLKTNFSKNVRRIPGSIVRYSAFIEEGAILMPSFVNVGARVGSGTMIDTWATVGSCAQVGKNCHIAGGVGIGGVLEPPAATPVIIEDDCFIGSRCIIVEGSIIEAGAVLGANTVITATTQIIDVTGPREVIMKGRVPANAVVIPGVRQRAFGAGTYGVPCALIIGKRGAETDRKTSLNSALRDFGISA
ncbi:MAG: 2,3,4,5-tetrahydropyridine-2,6-dicarboxylate N-succinyltransferase [Planctomycetes bacterium]|nr:2,3,4,5-tetrahydropyridine-2,6-dicarboxylate N-succinyltransferase [Planctomycetota bacterium]